MDILSRIVKDKRNEVALKKKMIPQEELEHLPLYTRSCISLSKRLRESSTGIISEFKRRSPSKSVINQDHKVFEVARGYQLAGVCGMSVLTDQMYFGGSLEDLLIARASAEIPLLRKEFIIDTYQIVEAKAYGADVILLIAAVLSREEIEEFSSYAKKLGLEVLLEVHNEEELKKSIMPTIDMIGVNNRNLKTFTVDINTSISLSKAIPEEFVKVSESGISSIDNIHELQKHGFKGFLIGETFMKTANPGEAAKEFIEQI